MNPFFLWVLLNRLRATGYFRRNARMQINRKFNASELSVLKIPVPPLVLQEKYASDILAFRALESAQSSSRKNLDALFQSMLHRAFQGEL
jgi:type I restriction enzyme S subunit